MSKKFNLTSFPYRPKSPLPQLCLGGAQSGRCDSGAGKPNEELINGAWRRRSRRRHAPSIPSQFDYASSIQLRFDTSSCAIHLRWYRVRRRRSPLTWLPAPSLFRWSSNARWPSKLSSPTTRPPKWNRRLFPPMLSTLPRPQVHPTPRNPIWGPFF